MTREEVRKKRNEYLDSLPKYYLSEEQSGEYLPEAVRVDEFPEDTKVCLRAFRIRKEFDRFHGISGFYIGCGRFIAVSDIRMGQEIRVGMPQSVLREFNRPRNLSSSSPRS